MEDYPAVKKLVLNASIKAFWYTNDNFMWKKKYLICILKGNQSSRNKANNNWMIKKIYGGIA